MLFEEPSTKEHLSRIVYQLGRNASWHDDLMQEAMIHLWFLESRHPGHTVSWYLQGCLFHLKNYLSAGRSVDSVKRQHRPDLLSENLDSAGFELVGEDSIRSEIIAREIVGMLKKVLDPLGQAILAHLAEGFGYREIGRKLGLSHPAVIKHRRGIAALAIRLGIAPLRDKRNSLNDESMNGSGRATRQKISRRANTTITKLRRQKGDRKNTSPSESTSFLREKFGL